MLSTILMFAIVQGLYMLRVDEVREKIRDPELEDRTRRRIMSAHA